jgi:hypothetical protein
MGPDDSFRETNFTNPHPPQSHPISSAVQPDSMMPRPDANSSMFLIIHTRTNLIANTIPPSRTKKRSINGIVGE